ncbi:hypothetical protein LCGC14_1129970 [marine sediment metagenome]|uniref:Uncharacterized protein n=1 Tax=marine sediment metagenome TaxID=412755 RepID=A0A0F9Q761_9ZZZZ
MPDKTPMQGARVRCEPPKWGTWTMETLTEFVEFSVPTELGEVCIPRDQFDRMVRWYVTGDPYGKLEVVDE